MLKVHVSNGSRMMGELELPSPPDGLTRQLETLRQQGQPNDALYISSVESVFPSLSWHLQHTRLDGNSTLPKLNQLARAIDGMDAAERYHMCAALDTEHRQDLDDALWSAAHVKPGGMDDYEVIPDVAEYQDLGRWLVEHDRLEEKVPEALRPYLDYRAIGLDYCGGHEGRLLANGYIGLRTEALGLALAEQGVLRLELAASNRTVSLSLPANDERLEQAKKDLEVEDFAQAVITGAEYTMPDLNGLVPMTCITVEDANTLALCLQEMEREDGELMKFCAVLEVEQPDAFAETLNIAMDCDDYELIPEDMDEYGKQVLRRTGADDEVMDTIDGYMDFAQLGRDAMEEDGVRRTGFGLVRRLSEPFPPEPEIGQVMS